MFLQKTAGTINKQEDQKAVKEPVSDNSPQTNFKALSVKLPKGMAKVAEIRWVLKVVLSHFSYRSCLDTNKLFKTMFPDSAIVKKFSMSKTKCAYVIHFGIASIFKDDQIEQVRYIALQLRQLLRIKRNWF